MPSGAVKSPETRTQTSGRRFFDAAICRNTLQITAPRVVASAPANTGDPMKSSHVANNRLRPDLAAGSLVWWQSGLYIVEGLELQGQVWTAVLVRPGKRKDAVQCWFAPLRECEIETLEHQQSV